MLTKMLIIVGVSVATVVAMFVMGHFLAKASDKKEKEARKWRPPRRKLRCISLTLIQTESERSTLPKTL